MTTETDPSHNHVIPTAMTLKRRNFVLSLVLTSAVIGIIFYKTNIGEIANRLYDVELGWTVFAVLVQVLLNLLWSLRWSKILMPTKRVLFINSVSASMIGMLANNFTPMKLGELVRSYVLSKREGLRKTQILTSIFVEKIVESLTLLAVFFCTYPYLISILRTGRSTLHNAILKGIGIFIVLNIAIILALVIIFRLRHRRPVTIDKLFNHLPRTWADRIVSRIEMFYEGLQILKLNRALLPVCLISLLYWYLVGLRIYSISNAFGISIPFTGAFLVAVCVLASISISVIPGNIGVHHVGSTLGLILLNVDLTTAASASVLLHGVPYIVSTVMGTGFLWREHISPFKLANIAEKYEP